MFERALGWVGMEDDTLEPISSSIAGIGDLLDKTKRDLVAATGPPVGSGYALIGPPFLDDDVEFVPGSTGSGMSASQAEDLARGLLAHGAACVDVEQSAGGAWTTASYWAQPRTRSPLASGQRMPGEETRWVDSSSNGRTARDLYRGDQLMGTAWKVEEFDWRWLLVGDDGDGEGPYADQRSAEREASMVEAKLELSSGRGRVEAPGGSRSRS